MFNRKCHCLRMLILGAAATGLLWPILPAVAQTTNVPATKKKATPKPTTAVRNTEPPRLLAVPEGATATKAVVKSDSQLELAGGEKSEVQKQLEALYEQDGREMPDLTVPTMQSIKPNGTAPQQQGATTPPPNAGNATQPKLLPTQSPSKPAQGHTQYQPRTQQATPYPAQSGAQAPRNFGAAIDAQENAQQPPAQNSAQTSSRPRPVVSLFKKITGTGKPATNPNPVPPDYANAKPPANKPVQSAPAIPVTPPAQLPQVASVPIATNSAPATARVAPALPPLNNGVRPIQQPVLSTASLNSKQSTTSVQVISSANSAPLELSSAPAMPALLAQPIVMPTVTTQLPPLMDEPIAQVTPEVTAPPELKTTPRTAEVTVDFPNPFPEGSETEVDRKPLKATQKKAVVAREIPHPLQERVVNVVPKVRVETPKLADEPVKIAPPEIAVTAEPAPATTTISPEPTLPALEAPVVAAQPASESSPPAIETENETASVGGPAADEDPFAVDAKDFVEPSITPKADPAPATPAVELPAETPAETPKENPAEAPNETPVETPVEAPASADASEPPVLAAPTTESIKPAIETPLLTPPPSDATSIPSPIRNEDPHMEKMRRIRERFGMKGLKGFCPVTLHNERELVDARPEYHSTFRSQRFHFASPEARDKFEAEPSRYAPAAYGADVVALSRDKDVIEGTLDFAAWFKGRLYLFGTQANYDTFIASPAKFVTLAGIE